MTILYFTGRFWAGERAQQLAELAALEEDSYLVPRTHIKWIITPSNSSSGDLKLSSGLLGYSHSWHTHRHINKSMKALTNWFPWKTQNLNQSIADNYVSTLHTKYLVCQHLPPQRWILIRRPSSCSWILIDAFAAEHWPAFPNGDERECENRGIE